MTQAKFQQMKPTFHAVKKNFSTRFYIFFFFLLLRMQALALLKMAESTHYHISSLPPKKLSYMKTLPEI